MTENVYEFHVLLAIHECIFSSDTHLHDSSMIDTNVFWVLEFAQRTYKFFLLHQFLIIKTNGSESRPRKVKLTRAQFRKTRLP